MSEFSQEDLFAAALANNPGAEQVAKLSRHEKEITGITKNLPTAVQQAADRAVAKKRSHKEADDWDGIVKSNRAKRTIVYHDQQIGSSKSRLTANKLAGHIVPTDALERALYKPQTEDDVLEVGKKVPDWVEKAKRRALAAQTESRNKFRAKKSRGARERRKRERKKAEAIAQTIAEEEAERRLEQAEMNREADLEAMIRSGENIEATYAAKHESNSDSDSDEDDETRAQRYLKGIAGQYSHLAFIQNNDSDSDSDADAPTGLRYDTRETHDRRGDSDSETDTDSGLEDEEEERKGGMGISLDFDAGDESSDESSDEDAETNVAAAAAGFDEASDDEGAAPQRDTVGLNYWAGAGASNKSKKRQRRRAAIQKTAAIAKKQSTVTYGRDVSRMKGFAKYQASKTAHPLISSDEHNAIMAAPLGREWNNTANYHRQIREREVVRAGAAVMPLRKTAGTHGNKAAVKASRKSDKPQI
ncbi:Small-subunit processome Utp14 [Carpediemonas membranifera]|uniref:Small-subunit processome Utp14 n=1 Tax=Carpediemonas membranifera TaxID=201153 RepID=A0A8J6AVD0_9EUKA|nr:Small-subunit processome Utp14 [Carpediemonas membranifera]|eukprot:KAG9395731.1 Small-subunit processome Utp14 [Carpediemonas membranifera]